MQSSNVTIAQRMDAAGYTSGFDYLRIVLAVSVLCWHAIGICYGQPAARQVWEGPFRSIPALILPMFFSLSGFLVAGSLERNSLNAFVTLRGVRILPALAVEILLSALILGPLLTSFPLAQYFAGEEFRTYFLNILGIIHFNLPGVFLDNPRSGWVNGSLWTIPYELECYLALVVAAFLGIAKRRGWFLIFTLIAGLGQFGWDLARGDLFSGGTFVPGRVLVVSFLAGVCIYQWRDVVRLNAPLLIGSLMLSVLFLHVQTLIYLAFFPVAYLTVWLGLQTPRKIPVLMSGDYSYGVYLFAFPIQQAAVAIWPSTAVWWANIAIALPLSFLYAAFSWHCIEKPFLHRKKTALAFTARLGERFKNALPTSAQRLIEQRTA